MTDIGVWRVHTERSHEQPRTGLGRDDLMGTLRALRERGDTSATVGLRNPARVIHVDLSSPYPRVPEIADLLAIAEMIR